MATYELPPRQALELLCEKRDEVQHFADETLDQLLEWRDSSEDSWWMSTHSRYPLISAQLTALELSLRRLNDEIAALEVEIENSPAVEDSPAPS